MCPIKQPLLLIAVIVNTLACLVTAGPEFNHSTISILYYILDHWAGENVESGHQFCMTDMKCEWTVSANMSELLNSRNQLITRNTSTVALYNIHSLWEKYHVKHPINCEWQTSYTMATSEESATRFHTIFDDSFANFDGNSTTSPNADVQRIYDDAYLRSFHLEPENGKSVNPGVTFRPSFDSLIKGASYVVNDCHTGNSGRDKIVRELRLAGLRVDGLGRCHKSNVPGMAVLRSSHNITEHVLYKREAIGKYLFHLAFENSLEDGYVTEKPFDALIAGSVPIYLGDTELLKKLVPDPKSIIYIADYNHNYTKLSEYLNYLSENEIIYEEYRNWKKNFSYEKNIQNNSLLRDSWYCKVCSWVRQNIREKKISKMSPCLKK